MRLVRALLVIVDISGYTEFITMRQVSLLHAEQIITELMESVIDRCVHPLTVNKLEGDAALLFREHDPADARAVTVDVLAQVGAFFPAFDACLARVKNDRRHCSCDACTNTDRLRLKAFVHVGEIAIKKVRQFEELAGEDVIAIHRMLKNTVPSREYVLVSTPVHDDAGDALAAATPHREKLDGIGETTLWLIAPGELPRLPERAAEPAPAPAEAPAEIRREKTFNHLPGAGPTGLSRWWTALRARLTGA